MIGRPNYNQARLPLKARNQLIARVLKHQELYFQALEL